MPITLNHSNISVQYSSDKSYIIETVKSDLYRRNENVDTVIRNNIQTAPITPTTYVDSSGNVYAVESYTYSGTANTADYTRVFPKNTTCDILIVGGGGGGGQLGGGGGSGNILFATNFTLNAGNYNIKVGKGGTGAGTSSQNGNNGENSSITINAIEHIAKGGGGGGSRDSAGVGRNGVAGGSGGGGSHSNSTTIQGLGGESNKNIYANWLSYGNNGGNGRLGIAGSEPTHAGGGGGGAGSVGQNTSLTTGGGNGGSGLNFSSTFGTSVGHNGWFGGGGGGWTGFGAGVPGYGNGGNGLFGGGGNGGFDGGELAAQDALPNTGGGGGGSKFDGGVAADNDGGSGGSGIVIIRYLLGTIPTTNFLTNEPTISPNNNIYSNTFFPRTPSTNSSTWTDNGYTVKVKDISSADLWYSNFPHLLFDYNLGSSFHSSLVFNGSGWSYVGSSRFKTLTGLPFSIDLGRAIYPTRMRITPSPFDTTYGTKQDFINAAPKAFKIFASNDAECWNNDNHYSWTLIHDQTTALPYTLESAFTYNTVPTIVNFQSNLPKYRYYTMVVLSLVGNYAGGYMMLSEWLIGGDEKIDAISEGTLNKRLDFVCDITKNVEYQTQLKTGVGGWRIVRFLPPTSSTWYPINDNLVGSTSRGSSYNYTNFWTIPFGTFDEFVFASLNMNYWLYCTKTTAYASYNNTAANIIKSSFSATPYTALWFNRGAGNPEDPLILIHNSTSDLVYAENSSLNGKGFISIDGGMCVLVRDSTASTSISDTNQYSLNFPVPTLTDINNNSNIVLRGTYDISLSTSYALIIPKENQFIYNSINPITILKDSDERMYPPVRNFTADTVVVSGQTYGNGTYVVSASSFYSGENPFCAFNNAINSAPWTTSTAYPAGGVYTGSFNINGFIGEWIKIRLPVRIKLTRYIIDITSYLSASSALNKAPSIYKIFGSNDNTVWQEIVYKSVALVSGSYVSNKFEENVFNNNYYNFFVLVVGKNVNGDFLSIGEWFIYGKEQVSNPLSIRYHLLNPTLDPIGAQWTYSSNNTNVYHIGSVGIGTTSPEYQLDVRGNIYSSSGGYTQSGLTTWSITSDRRIKDNIVKASYEKCLENVKNIELYNFTFKNNYVNTNDRHQLGFIAQEVQQVYPKAVEVGKIMLNANETIDNVLTLNTTQIDYTLYGAVKNIIEKIDNIDNELSNIETLI